MSKIQTPDFAKLISRLLDNDSAATLKDYQAAIFEALKALAYKDGNEKLVSTMPDRQYNNFVFMLGNFNEFLQSLNTPEAIKALESIGR